MSDIGYGLGYGVSISLTGQQTCGCINIKTERCYLWLSICYPRYSVKLSLIVFHFSDKKGVQHTLRLTKGLQNFKRFIRLKILKKIWV